MLNTYIKMIYDYYGDPYDFTLDTTINAYPTCEEADEMFGKFQYALFIKKRIGENAPHFYIEDVERRMEKEDFAYNPLKPKEYKDYIPKDRRMPYRMMAEYVDRKAKKATKPKRKVTKKKGCGCK